MNERWKKEILNLLLDKYERTAAYQKGELPDRRVILRFYDSGKTRRKNRRERVYGGAFCCIARF